MAHAQETNFTSSCTQSAVGIAVRYPSRRDAATVDNDEAIAYPASDRTALVSGNVATVIGAYLGGL